MKMRIEKALKAKCDLERNVELQGYENETEVYCELGNIKNELHQDKPLQFLFYAMSKGINGEWSYYEIEQAVSAVDWPKL